MLTNITDKGNPELKLRNTIWKENHKDIIKSEKNSSAGNPLKLAQTNFKMWIIRLQIFHDR